MRFCDIASSYCFENFLYLLWARTMMIPHCFYKKNFSTLRSFIVSELSCLCVLVGKVKTIHLLMQKRENQQYL